MESRRTFLKTAVVGIATFFVFLWNKLTLHSQETNQTKQHTFLFNKNKRVSFNDNFIVVSLNNSTRVFSAHCTHLGCKIDKMEDDRFVCPCHGSEYDLNGIVLKGPAYKNLELLPSHLSEDGKNIIIEA